MKNATEFIVKDEPGFRLRVKSWRCKNPSNLNALEFIQEVKCVDGTVESDSTYSFLLTDDEIKVLCHGLAA